MPRKRSTFRARKPMKTVNSRGLINNKEWHRQMWAKRRLAAAKKPGAGVALSEIIGAAMCRRDRRNALRAAHHAKSFTNYHPVHAVNASLSLLATAPKRPRSKKAA